MTLTYRPATELDHEWLWQLRCESMRECVEAIWGWDEAFQLERFGLSAAADPWQIVLAGERAVGAMVVYEEADHVYLANLYVVARDRGRGVGRSVMQALQHSARSRRLPIRLHVLTSNPRAQKFYELLGFRFKSEEDHRRLYEWFRPKFGHTTHEMLAEAEKARQQSRAQDIGKVLFELGYVGEREVLQARAHERGFPFADLSRLKLEVSTVELISESTARSYGVLPVKRESNYLYLAMTNPSNTEAADAVRRETGLKIVPVAAVPAEIERVIAEFWKG